MKTPIRTALVGYGSVAEKMHAPLIDVCPDLDFIGVVERNGNRCQDKYPGVTTFRSLDELLIADLADLVVITTPNEFHFPMAKQCLLAGKHVVVDKPVTIYSHEAEELDALAKEKNLICSPRKPGTSNCPGFSRRASLRRRRSPGLPRPDHKHTHKYCRCTFSFPFSFRLHRYFEDITTEVTEKV